MNKNERKVPRRIAQTILNSLKGGVVPRIGLPYIAVGRKNEIEALLHDVDIIAEGGASFRFIVGRYGSGKSFLIQTIRNYVMDRGFIVADADLSPERRHQGSKRLGVVTVSGAVDLVDDILRCQYLSDIFEEQRQQIVLHRGDMKIFSVQTDLVSLQVNG